MKAMIIKTDISYEIKDIKDNYKALGQVVGGAIEYVELNSETMTMYCNECGKLDNLPVNLLATRVKDTL